MGIRLLASLLPGLRDVRVPLTVGYLWFFNLWLWFSDNVPRTSPSGDGLISRAFELEEILGFASTIGAVSFCAYLLGLMAQVPSNFPVPRWAQAAFWIESNASRQTRLEYQDFLRNLSDRVEMKSNGLAPDDYDEVSADIGRALHASGDTLRPSLLVANQELYGEYDRLNSEGSFRINVCLPLLALGASLTISVSWWWLLAALTTVYVLLSQGLRRRSQSITVIQGAVLSGIIKHPAKSILERFG